MLQHSLAARVLHMPLSRQDGTVTVAVLHIMTLLLPDGLVCLLVYDTQSKKGYPLQCKPKATVLMLVATVNVPLLNQEDLECLRATSLSRSACNNMYVPKLGLRSCI